MNDLLEIKKKYGEKMMHFCRKSFSTILEEDGKLPLLLKTNFNISRELYTDLQKQYLLLEFKNYIINLYNESNNNKIIPVIESDKTPTELLDEANYIFYECKTEKDIQSFKKYYAKGEELCTFNENRLNACYVFFAIKKDVASIKRENFSNPKRQDEYGTSVISIQFTKDSAHVLSIKNRYNHIVKENCDATFSNNLDNIIPGLTESFKIHYNLEQQYPNSFEINGYVRANDGKFYKYNSEINNIYYCTNNIIIDKSVVKKYDEKDYIIFDHYILNLKDNIIDYYDNRIKDSFKDTLKNIKHIKVTNIKGGRKIEIYLDLSGNEPVTITIDSKNRFTKLINNNVTLIPSNFMNNNHYITVLILNNAKSIDDFSLNNLEVLQITSFNSLKEIGIGCFTKANLRRARFPKTKIINKASFQDAKLTKVYFPKLKKINRDAFNGSTLTEVSFRKLEKIAQNSFYMASLYKVSYASSVNIGKRCFIDSVLINVFIFEIIKLNDSALDNANLKNVVIGNIIEKGKHTFYNAIVNDVHYVEDSYISTKYKQKKIKSRCY